MSEFLTLQPEAFGLDISDLSLKIIKLKKEERFFSLPGRRKSSSLKLASFGEEKIKPGIIKNGEIRGEEALVESLKRSLTNLKGEKLETNYVVASLPEEKTFLEVIQMPKMIEKDLKSAVIYEAENYIPLPIEKVYLDFRVISPVSNNLDHLDVLIVAMPRKTIDSYLSCLKKAGLVPKALEIESQAIARALIKNGISSLPILLIDLGATRTSFIIFSGHSMRFTCSIPFSSQNLTEAISETLKVDLNEAEKLKFKYGIQSDTKTKNNEVCEALIPPLNDLTEQIKKYLSFYLTHDTYEHVSPNGKKGIEKILLCGGGANLKGLTEFLSLELKVSVELANPWVNILSEPQKEVPELSFEKSLAFTTALGLALRGVGK
ncbi:type IV pilus assembly protein PilM [Patescibacteria group bacterium]